MTNPDNSLRLAHVNDGPLRQALEALATSHPDLVSLADDVFQITPEGALFLASLIVKEIAPSTNFWNLPAGTPDAERYIFLPG